MYNYDKITLSENIIDKISNKLDMKNNIENTGDIINLVLSIDSDQALISKLHDICVLHFTCRECPMDLLNINCSAPREFYCLASDRNLKTLRDICVIENRMTVVDKIVKK